MDGNTPIKIAILQKSPDFVDLLLKSSANIQGVKASDFMEVYGKKAPDILRLTEGPGGIRTISFVQEDKLKHDTATTAGERRLL
jgi:ankyrin repeat protein